MVKIFDRAIVTNGTGKLIKLKLGPHNFLGQEHTWTMTIYEGKTGEHDTDNILILRDGYSMDLNMHINQNPAYHMNEGHSNKATKFSRKEKRALR